MTKPKVHANGRSILHAGDGLQHVCAVPDACKTPTPAGPQPAAYINVGNSSDLADGSKQVKIGGKSIALAGSALRQTTGNEPGTLGGLVSGKVKGKASWIQGMAGSTNVFVEGCGVVRFLDAMMHNGNTYNAAFKAAGHTGFAYADDFDGLCPICSMGPERHRILEHESTVLKADQLIANLKDARTRKGAKPVTRKGGGYMVAVMTCRCKQTWAAMSGDTTHLGFVDVAKGVATSVGHVVTGGAVSMEQMWAVNRSPLASDRAAEFETHWRRVHKTQKKRTPGYSIPGQCAAAKILVASAGHTPLSMTERFFAPKSEWRATYRVRQTEVSQEALKRMTPNQRRLVFRNVLADPSETMSFVAGPGAPETVASCHTCQELLYLLMCEAPPCG